MILVDDSDGNAAQELSEIGLRIEEAVEDRREHDQAEGAAIVRIRRQFGGHRRADAGAGERQAGRGRARRRAARIAAIARNRSHASAKNRTAGRPTS